jgi:hypothetical protein
VTGKIEWRGRRLRSGTECAAAWIIHVVLSSQQALLRPAVAKRRSPLETGDGHLLSSGGSFAAYMQDQPGDFSQQNGS